MRVSPDETADIKYKLDISTCMVGLITVSGYKPLLPLVTHNYLNEHTYTVNNEPCFFLTLLAYISDQVLQASSLQKIYYANKF